MDGPVFWCKVFKANYFLIGKGYLLIARHIGAPHVSPRKVHGAAAFCDWNHGGGTRPAPPVCFLSENGVVSAWRPISKSSFPIRKLVGPISKSTFPIRKLFTLFLFKIRSTKPLK